MNHHQPVLSRSGQDIYRFPNGYGASVIQHQFSYGRELAVIQFDSEDADRFALVYDTPITGDVIGHVDDDTLTDTLDAIEALPRKTGISGPVRGPGTRGPLGVAE